MTTAGGVLRRLKHVGAEAFLAQRDNLLKRYDNAKKEAADDAVHTEHGVVGEAIIREWLQRYLPKRYGVTKGFIITHNLEYAGPIEEWDIIIYDKLEAPVLFVRDSPESTAAGLRRAIPVEHVRGVVEVKATFRVDMARKMREKLSKLHAFIGKDTSRYPMFLQSPFTCTGIFFETNVANYAQFRAALDELAPLGTGEPSPFGFLILRSQTAPEHTGYAQFCQSKTSLGDLHTALETSSEFTYADGTFGFLGCLGGWGVNNFPTFVFDLLANLRGDFQPGRASSFYGMDFENYQGTRLFPIQQAKQQP